MTALGRFGAAELHGGVDTTDISAKLHVPGCTAQPIGSARTPRLSTVFGNGGWWRLPQTLFIAKCHDPPSDVRGIFLLFGFRPPFDPTDFGSVRTQRAFLYSLDPGQYFV